jgi:thiamine biosynthesis protein ThiS
MASSVIHVTANGQPRELPAGSTLLELLQKLAIKPEHVAVELNGEIVPRRQCGERVLTDGAVLEIVHFVGGG